jgi:diguanylate cyclase (GGDEF)-like protein
MALDSEWAVETYYQATTSRLVNIMVEIDKAHQRLQEVSRLDGLTQVLNRHTFMEALEAELHRCIRYQHPLTLAMVDLDHFKQVNDRFGHQFGDYVLQKTMQLIKSSTRISDIIGRYGGEEFCIVLVETDLKSAISELERLRLKVASTNYEYEGKQDYLTISIGLSELTPALKNKEELISNADKALMEAKEAGRNTLRVYEKIG